MAAILPPWSSRSVSSPPFETSWESPRSFSNRFQSGNTAGQVFGRLVKQFPGLERYRAALLVAVNQEYSDWNQEISAGDEIAFFPPVSGGTE